MSSVEPVAAETPVPMAAFTMRPRRDDGLLHAAIFAGLLALDRGRAVPGLSGLRHAGDVLRALRLGLQPAARLWRAAVLRPCGLFRPGLLRLRHGGAELGARSRALAILLGTLASGVLGAVFGAIAIRRQGIYFSMITLALAQIVYFVALQAPFTGGEDGIQGVPRGRSARADRPHVGCGALRPGGGGLPRRAAAHLPHRALALRPGAAGHPREREPGPVAGLPGRPLPPRGLHHVGDAERPRRRHQGAGVPARLADRRALDHVGRGRADDADRRHGHDLRARPSAPSSSWRWNSTWPPSAPG